MAAAHPAATRFARMATVTRARQAARPGRLRQAAPVLAHCLKPAACRVETTDRPPARRPRPMTVQPAREPARRIVASCRHIPHCRSPRATLATQPTADKAINRDVMVFGGIVISLIRPGLLTLSRV